MKEDTRRSRRGSERISGDVDEICARPESARRVANELARLAGTHVTPGRTWTPEDLRDVLEAALRASATEPAPQVFPGRELRRRLHLSCSRAARYGERFACIVLAAARSVDRAAHQGIVDAIVERVRATDAVFVYRRRFAIVMPQVGVEATPAIVNRVMKMIAIGAGERAIVSTASIAFPAPGVTGAAVLDWAEDQLRE